MAHSGIVIRLSHKKALREGQKQMAKQPQTWPVTCKRFVAFLDIMGFKDRMLRNPHQDVLETMKSFRLVFGPLEQDAREALFGGKQSPEDDIYGTSIVRPVFFSDSVLLVSNDVSFGSANRMLFSVQWILRKALLTQVPIKGAIACGEQTADFEDSLYFGAPLIDAYELQDQVNLYGVVLHHTMERCLDDMKWPGTDKSRLTFPDVVKYPVPLKGGNVNHRIVRWFEVNVADGSLESSLLKLYGTVSGSPRSYVDNTLDLARWLDARRKEDLNTSRPTVRGTKKPI